jgi:radical SAM superfamily enzyme YgiQ (UPF0313 family)/uncharacterized Fe-S cluster-containing radical SAM superfamily protein
MKVVLINSGDLVGQNYSPSIGIGYIKSYLTKKLSNKISVEIVRKDILNTIFSKKPDLVGINALSNNYQDAINLAILIKKYFQNVKIVIGGVHITVAPKDFNSVFDFGVIGEGEETMFELISLITKELELGSKELGKAQLKKINGICFFDKKKLVITKKRSPIKDLDSIPNIDRNDFLGSNYHYILTSRGCPFNCLFCASSAIWGSNKARFFSAKYIYREIKALKSLGVDTITISDDMFLSNIIILKELITYIKADKDIYKKTNLVITTRADFISEEIGPLLKEIGCISIKTGLESTSEILHRKLRNSDFKLFDRMLAVIKKNKINLILNLNVNNPWQDSLEYLKIFNFLKRNEIKDFNIYYSEPYPGTYYWDYALSKKIIDKNFSLLRLNIIGHKSINEISEKDIIPLSKLIGVRELIFWTKKINSLKEKKRNQIFNLVLLKMQRIPNFLTKKLKYFSNNKSEFPEVVRWIITTKCNLNCKMCLNKQMRNSTPAEDISYIKIQDQISEISKNHSRLVIHGGEPTLNKELIYLIRAAFINKINVQCFTNLYSPDTKYIDDLVYFGLKSFNTSIDHIDPKLHDNIRNVPNCFEKTINNVIYLTDLKKKYLLNITISVASVIVRQNFKILSQIYDYFESMGGIDVWTLRHNTFYYANKNFYLKSSNKFNMKNIEGQEVRNNHFFSRDEIKILNNELKLIKNKSQYYVTKLGIKDDISKNLVEYYYLNNFSKSYCGNFIDKNVKIVGYEVQTECGYPLGMIGFGKTITEIWKSRKNKEFQDFVKIKKIPQCFRCARIKYEF